MKRPAPYTRKRIEDCVTGDILDMGTFVRIDPRDEAKQGINTRNVLLSNGYHYTETAGAQVRVWRSLDARRNYRKRNCR